MLNTIKNCDFLWDLMGYMGNPWDLTMIDDQQW
jgi:hypothetical protein